MKALVTGGAGFIGSHLVGLLLEQGHAVIVLDNLVSGDLQNLKPYFQDPLFSFQNCDVRQRKEIQPHFFGIDWVFHLSALVDLVPSLDTPDDYFDVNVTGTVNVLEAARKAAVKKLVYAASCSCYGHTNLCPTSEIAPIQPLVPYSLTKYLGEQIVLHWEEVYKLSTISLRLFNVYGPRMKEKGGYGSVITTFLKQKREKKPFTIVGDGFQTRDFVYVGDVVKAFYDAAKSSISGEVMNVGTGKETSVNCLAAMLQGEKIHVPKRTGEATKSVADICKIERLLNWKPSVSLEDGISKCWSGIL